jgi:hypothetical protein
MTTFHSGVYELSPDINEILLLRPEHVNALTPGDLAVEAVFLGHGSNGDQFICRDLAAGDSWNDRETAVPLDIGEEFVVGVLQVVETFVDDVWVEQAGENRRNGGFAYFAANRGGICSYSLHDIGERLQLLDCDDVVEVRTRVWNVRTYYTH